MWGFIESAYDVGYFILRNVNDLKWEALALYLFYILGKRKGMKKAEAWAEKHYPKYFYNAEKQWRAWVTQSLEKMGAEPCGTSEIAISGRQSYVKSWITSCKATLKSLCYYLLRRKKKMRNYLKKLGSRKFQAFLIVTITNLIILGGYLMGNIDLEGKVEQWMPAINLVVQAVVTGVYQWVEGKADAAGASNSGESYH